MGEVQMTDALHAVLFPREIQPYAYWHLQVSFWPRFQGASKEDVSERSASAGSEEFSLLICLGVTKFEFLKWLCHPWRMHKPMKTNLKKSTRLFQVLSEILEGCFYLRRIAWKCGQNHTPRLTKRPLPVDVHRSKKTLFKLPFLF